MTKRFTVAAAFVAAVALMAGAAPAFAQSTETSIGGDVNQTADVDNIIVTAIGEEVVAIGCQNCVFEGTSIEGDLNQTARADNIIVTTIGVEAYAVGCQNCISIPKPR